MSEKKNSLQEVLYEASDRFVNAQKSTKRKLCDAAIKIVLTQGIANLTLEAAADEGGTSKGGLLYHFPSKDALITEVIHQALSDFEKAVENARQDSASEQKWLSAFMATVTKQEYVMSLGAALLIAASESAKFLDLFTKKFEVWRQNFLSDGVQPDVIDGIFYTLTGYWVVVSLIHPADPDGTAKVQKVLLALMKS